MSKHGKQVVPLTPPESWLRVESDLTPIDFAFGNSDHHFLFIKTECSLGDWSVRGEVCDTPVITHGRNGPATEFTRMVWYFENEVDGLLFKMKFA